VGGYNGHDVDLEPEPATIDFGPTVDLVNDLSVNLVHQTPELDDTEGGDVYGTGYRR
jgi:hypothetical protein